MSSDSASTPPEQNKALTVLGQFIGDIQELMPETIKKNVLKAGNQLIFGMAEIPVAWLEQFSKRIRRKTEAMDMIQQGENAAIVKLFEQDPTLAQETLNFNSLKEYKAFFNRKKVMDRAIDELKNDPPEEDTKKEIDEDWLEMFSRAAETKSSEQVQMIFSKILAGEIRKPGAFRPSTINILSLLDKSTASKFLGITRYICHPLLGGIPLQPHIIRFSFIVNDGSGLISSANIPHEMTITQLQEMGLIRPTEMLSLEEIGVTNGIMIGRDFFHFIPDENIIQEFEPGSEEYSVLKFTSAGRELLQIVNLKKPIDGYQKQLTHLIMSEYGLNLRSHRKSH